MAYRSVSGEVTRTFDTFLELRVAGQERPEDHQAHMHNGYHHGLGDSMNQREKRDFLKLTVGILAILSFLTVLFVCVSRRK